MIDPPHVIGPRLKALRLAVGQKTQTKFAEEIGLTKQAYNPWETGKRELTFEGACLIRKKFRIPLDYLFFGEVAQVPMEVREQPKVRKKPRRAA